MRCSLMGQPLEDDVIPIRPDDMLEQRDGSTSVFHAPKEDKPRASFQFNLGQQNVDAARGHVRLHLGLMLRHRNVPSTVV